jgi:hypothetical protein
MAFPVFNYVAPKVAALRLSAGFGALYFPGARAAVQGDTCSWMPRSRPRTAW